MGVIVKGYDAWRLRGPDRGPECAYCGAPGWRVELRVIHAPNPYKIGDDDLCCEECFPASDTGPCFDDCPLPEGCTKED